MPTRDDSVLATMTDCLAHRGPDDRGMWWSADRVVGLGHRRLSIIDLSERGHQPMQSADGRYVVVFNGEIYNHDDLRDRLARSGHEFRSSSDTEVLLAAFAQWGPECLRELDGMFAFAVYDQVGRRIVAARDRAGEKPLFYRVDATGLAFASELKALFADRARPRRVDADALNFYLAYGYVPGDRCLVEGYRKLPPAHVLDYWIDDGTCAVDPFWELPSGRGDRLDDDEASNRLDDLLHESVRRRLLTSDVPVGVLLSGGLDSSLLAAVAAHVSPSPIQTFTVTFPGHGAFDEAVHARRVATSIGSQHVELPLEPASVELLPVLAQHFDEPIADSSMLPTYLLSRLVRQHVTVALGGDGGDELFGGYPHYQWLQWQVAARRWVPQAVRRLVSRASSHLPPGTRGRNHGVGIAGAIEWAIAHVNLYFDASLRHRLLARPVAERIGDLLAPEVAKAALAARGASVLQGATRADFSTYLADDLLVKVDRASMAHGLEVRAPWLAPAIVEFAFSALADDQRVRGSKRKVLLRRLARRHLPPDFDSDRKQGFSLPLHAWQQGPWGQAIADIVRNADPNWLSPTGAEAILASQRAGHGNNQRLFSLAMLELWRRAHGIEMAW